DLEPDRELALSADVVRAFAGHRWPGNVRQLVNVLRTACALLGDDESCIERIHLPEDLLDELAATPPVEPALLASEAVDTDLRQQAERCIAEAVRSSAGNLSEAARRLGISRNTLYRKLRERTA
ncbi:MAG: hypothetical protein RLZZ524_1338, partial [Pseudomonadota bacterium]